MLAPLLPAVPHPKWPPAMVAEGDHVTPHAGLFRLVSSNSACRRGTIYLCHFFTVYDIEKDTVEIIDNSNQHHSHGMCQPMGLLTGKKIDAVACGGMGGRAVQKLNEGGIKAYRAVAGTVDSIASQFTKGKLEEITIENACAQHSCH